MPWDPDAIIATLSSVPARDGNFKRALDLATENQLQQAFDIMTDERGEPYPGEKSRARAVRTRLRQKRRGRGVPPSEA